MDSEISSELIIRIVSPSLLILCAVTCVPGTMCKTSIVYTGVCYCVCLSVRKKKVTRSSLKIINRSFKYAAPRLWNKAPRSRHVLKIMHKYFVYWDFLPHLLVINAQNKNTSQHLQVGQVPPLAHACRRPR